MSRICDLTGMKTSAGMKVSHSNRHTKRTFKPNLQQKTYQSEILARTVSLRLSTRAIRTIDKHNGFDGYMMQVRNARVAEGFSPLAKRLRSQVVKKAKLAGLITPRSAAAKSEKLTEKPAKAAPKKAAAKKTAKPA